MFACKHSKPLLVVEFKANTMKKERELPQSKAGRMAYIYKSMSNGIRSVKSTVPREWLKERGLSVEATGACFNSGQIHHRKSLEFKAALEEVGLLVESKVGTNCETIPYTVFGIFSVMFPLKDEQGNLVNFYSVRIRSNKTAYMNEEEGIYPGYPHEHTKRLFVVNNVLEAAILLESKILDNREAVIALHDGQFMPAHERAIQRLTKLEQILYMDTPTLEIIKKNV